MKKIRQNIIALVYDFDGTLTPKAMQEYTVLPNLKIKEAKKFWEDAEKESKRKQADKDLLWMWKIIKRAENIEKRIPRDYFKEQGKKIKYFKGVKQFFKSIDKYIITKSENKMKSQHYIVSSGLKEILEGTPIKKNFHNIYGSEYQYNYWGRPVFPKVLITDTLKTQYLFRINKGRENLGETINEYMPEKKRPIPFKNIIYIGDGFTDVPAMNVTKKNGGRAIAVYTPRNRRGLRICKKLLKAKRVDFIAPADYRKSSALYKFVKLALKTIIQEYEFEKYVEKNSARRKA